VRPILLVLAGRLLLILLLVVVILGKVMEWVLTLGPVLRMMLRQLMWVLLLTLTSEISKPSPARQDRTVKTASRTQGT
jgi:hypothetical protein